jgi:radical SAM protein with 4Fe4S-binding SPASM domain
MSLVTNGMLLTEEISRLVMPVLRDIKFSFDGATKSTFEKTRVGSDFETVLHNIRGFMKIREETSYHPSATLLVTLMYRNIRELPQVIELAHEFGVERVKGCFMVLRNPYEMSQSLWFHKELTNKILEKSEELAKSYDIKTKFYKKFDLNHETNENVGKIDCRFLWEEAWIKGNGDVIPCCNVDAPTIGNVYEELFKRIWNNDIYQKMRKKTGAGQPAECCKYCVLPNEDVPGDTFAYPYRSLILV